MSDEGLSDDYVSALARAMRVVCENPGTWRNRAEVIVAVLAGHGFKIVAREPTEVMLFKGHRATGGSVAVYQSREAWRAMWDAAE